MKRFISITLVATFILLVGCKSKKEQNQATYNKIPNSILIVYSSGMPDKTLSDIKPEEIEGVTGPTPSDMNVAIIAQSLSKQLIEKNYTVRLAKAEEIKSYKELMQYDMLIMGTPTYFWNIHWDMKKMIDECFEKIYVLRRDDFKKMKHITFAMSEYDKCAENANKQMEFAITDCSAKVDKAIVFTAKQTKPQYDQQIEQLSMQADSVMKLK